MQLIFLPSVIFKPFGDVGILSQCHFDQKCRSGPTQSQRSHLLSSLPGFESPHPRDISNYIAKLVSIVNPSNTLSTQQESLSLVQRMTNQFQFQVQKSFVSANLCFCKTSERCQQLGSSCFTSIKQRLLLLFFQEFATKVSFLWLQNVFVVADVAVVVLLRENLVAALKLFYKVFPRIDHWLRSKKSFTFFYQSTVAK